MGFDQVVCHAAHLHIEWVQANTPGNSNQHIPAQTGHRCTGSQVHSSPYSKLLECMPCVKRRLPSQLSGTGVTGGKDQLAARKSTPVSLTNQAYPSLTPDKLCTPGAACRLNTVHWHDLVPELCSRPALYHPCASHSLTPWPGGWPACALQSSAPAAPAAQCFLVARLPPGPAHLTHCCCALPLCRGLPRQREALPAALGRPV